MSDQSRNDEAIVELMLKAYAKLCGTDGMKAALAVARREIERELLQAFRKRMGAWGIANTDDLLAFAKERNITLDTEEKKG